MNYLIIYLWASMVLWISLFTYATAKERVGLPIWIFTGSWTIATAWAIYSLLQVKP